jgi:Ion channel
VKVMCIMPVPKPAADSRRLRERYGFLLLAIFTAFGLQGIATPGRFGQVIVSAVLAATLMLSLWAADARPRVLKGAFVIGIAVVATSLIASITGHVDNGSTRLANLLLVTLAPPAIVIGVLRMLRTRNRVTIEAVFGVLCLYMLLGMFFAFVYGSIARWLGGDQFFAQDVAPTVARCLYFSFTTLTTTGYGDLTAASNLGHTLSVLEALIGQIYLVTVVSLIVANLGRSRERGSPAA